MEIKKAVRKAIPFIGCLYGKSSGGKTYSALRLARGLIGEGAKICVIDTENGRASHYADYFEFDTLELFPPFTSARYIEAIKSAENAGYKAIIVDSISHEWDGIGGCLEMAEGKQGLQAWARPKAEHRKLINLLLQSKSHIIFCARAKDEVEQVRIGGKSEIVTKGLAMIQEKNFPFEMLVTFRMEEQGKAYLEKATGINPLKESFIAGSTITEQHGKIIFDWINRGDAVDLEEKKLKDVAREVAMNEGEDALKNWFSNLDEKEKILAAKFSVSFKKDLMKIAKEKEDGEAKILTLSSLKDSLSDQEKADIAFKEMNAALQEDNDK